MTAVASGKRAIAADEGLDFLDRPQYGPTGFDQQLGFYAEYLPWAKAGTAAPRAS